jgi:hypothetical protein
MRKILLLALVTCLVLPTSASAAADVLLGSQSVQPV